MVERARAEVGVVLGLVAEDGGRRRGRSRRPVPVHALGPARRARGVEHGRTPDGVGQIDALLSGDGVGVGLEAGDVPTDGQAHVGAGGLCDCGEPGIGHDGRGPAVGDDVGDLGRGEVPVDGRQAEAAPLGGGERLGKLRAVGAEQDDRVAGAHAATGQGASDGVGIGVELGGQHLHQLRIAFKRVQREHAIFVRELQALGDLGAAGFPFVALGSFFLVDLRGFLHGVR